MVDATYNLDEAKKERALWNAKHEILERIVNEIEFTNSWRDDLDEEDKALYISALDILSEAISDYGILPWNNEKGGE